MMTCTLYPLGVMNCTLLIDLGTGLGVTRLTDNRSSHDVTMLVVEDLSGRKLANHCSLTGSTSTWKCTLEK